MRYVSTASRRVGSGHVRVGAGGLGRAAALAAALLLTQGGVAHAQNAPGQGGLGGFVGGLLGGLFGGNASAPQQTAAPAPTGGSSGLGGFVGNLVGSLFGGGSAAPAPTGGSAGGNPLGSLVGNVVGNLVGGGGGGSGGTSPLGNLVGGFVGSLLGGGPTAAPTAPAQTNPAAGLATSLFGGGSTAAPAGNLAGALFGGRPAGAPAGSPAGGLLGGGSSPLGSLLGGLAGSLFGSAFGGGAGSLGSLAAIGTSFTPPAGLTQASFGGAAAAAPAATTQAAAVQGTANGTPPAGAENLPRSSAGFVQLPASGAGFYGYYGASRRWGKPELVYGILRAGQAWAQQGRGPRLGVGDISLENGGPISGHKSHQRGIDADCRPMRNDGKELAITIQEPAYDRARTQAILTLLARNTQVDVVFFNDRNVQPSTPLVNHDNHFHLRVR